MTAKQSSERLFDTDGNLVVGVGQNIPEDAKGLKALDVTPANPAYPAGSPDEGEDDPVNQPVHDAVTSVPLHTPAEQQLVDAGLMGSRDGDGVSTQSAPAGTPKSSKK